MAGPGFRLYLVPGPAFLAGNGHLDEPIYRSAWKYPVGRVSTKAAARGLGERLWEQGEGQRRLKQLSGAKSASLNDSHKVEGVGGGDLYSWLSAQTAL